MKGAPANNNRAVGDLPDAMTRALLCFFSVLAGMAVLATFAGGAEHLELNWLDLRWLPDALATGFLAMGSALWMAAVFMPGMSSARRRATSCITWLAAGVATLNGVCVGCIWISGSVGTGFPVPLSLLVAMALAWAAKRVGRGPGSEPVASLPVVAGWTVALACLWPLIQIVTLGRSDYRRQAQAAVVLGARVYADGGLSDAVADRVRTGAELYEQGLVRELIMSGGPGDGGIHETEAMRDEAIRRGVPAGAIRLDREGLSTHATAVNTSRMADRSRGPLLAVSEFYHLPRIRLAYAAQGWEVCTVPARPQYRSRWFPMASLAREVPAYWLYHFRAVLPGPRIASVSQGPV